MSHFVELETSMTDEEALVKALLRMGFSENQIERHAQATSLRDYFGKVSPQQANVVIRKNFSGISDLGWEKTKEGTFKSHLDLYKGKYDKPWQDKLQVNYNVEKTIKTLTKKRLRYTEDVDAEKRPRIRFSMK